TPEATPTPSECLRARWRLRPLPPRRQPLTQINARTPYPVIVMRSDRAQRNLQDVTDAGSATRSAAVSLARSGRRIGRPRVKVETRAMIVKLSVSRRVGGPQATR